MSSNIDPLNMISEILNSSVDLHPLLVGGANVAHSQAERRVTNILSIKGLQTQGSEQIVIPLYVRLGLISVASY